MDNIEEVRAKYKQGGVHHKIISAVSKHDLDTFEIRRDCGSNMNATDFRKELNRLAREKVLLSVGNDTWSITTLGLHLSVMLGAPSDYATRRRKANADRISNGNSTEVYVPVELGFTCLRPGAYDAFLLPSVRGGRRYYPNGRVEDWV
jgi:hypothetical protein